MDYLCAKFGNFIFSRFGVIVRADRITESHMDDRYTHATTVGVSDKKLNIRISIGHRYRQGPPSNEWVSRV